MSDKVTAFPWRQLLSEDGSAPDGRWGHSLNVVANRYVVVSGGIQSGKIFSDTWVYDFRTRKWGRCLATGDVPSARWGHSCTQVNSHTLLLLGGREGSKPAALSEFYELNLRTMKWTAYNTSQPAPKARYAHGCVQHPSSSNHYVVFGGHGGRSRYYNDVQVLRLPSTNGKIAELPGLKPATHSSALSTLTSWVPTLQKAAGAPIADDPNLPTWIQAEVTGTAPSKRSSFTATRVEMSMFVIGGYDGKDILNNIGVLNLETWAWSQPLVGGVGLPPLVGHTSEYIAGTGQLFIFGGGVSQLELSCSIFLLDTNSYKACAVTQFSSPSARFWHRCGIFKTSTDPMESPRLLMFGGSGESGQAYNDLVEIDLHSLHDDRGPAASPSETSYILPSGNEASAPSTMRAAALSMAVGMGGVGKVIAGTATGASSASVSDSGFHHSTHSKLSSGVESDYLDARRSSRSFRGPSDSHRFEPGHPRSHEMLHSNYRPMYQPAPGYGSYAFAGSKPGSHGPYMHPQYSMGMPPYAVPRGVPHGGVAHPEHGYKHPYSHSHADGYHPRPDWAPQHPGAQAPRPLAGWQSSDGSTQYSYPPNSSFSAPGPRSGPSGFGSGYGR